ARSQYEAMRHWPHGLVAISVRLMRRNLRSAQCETCRAGLGQTADSMLLVSGTQVEARRGRAGPGIAASSATRHNISTRVAPRLTRRRGSRRGGTELAAQPPHADINHVRPRVEVIAPDLGQEALPADHLADVQHQEMQ